MPVKYPFDPDTLDAMPERLAELYRELEVTLLMEIASRLKAADQLNEVTVQQIRALRSHGIPLKDIQEAIRKATGKSHQEIDQIFADVVNRNQTYYNGMADLAGITAPETIVGASDVAAIVRQTWSACRNITGSMGFLVVQGGRLVHLPPAKAYQWALDNALMEIQSGAISYGQAISKATRKLADSGLTVVDYKSGHHDHIDVAARRAVMTGITQLNNQYAIQSMEFLGTNYVEVSAHSGARDIPGPKGWEAHTEWQGRCFRWKR
jgi:DNA-binding transcriptional MerR regulator